MKPVQVELLKDRDDVPVCVDIDRLAFDRPWDDRDFERALRQPTVTGSVARVDGYQVGYSVQRPSSSEPTIVRLAVHPDFQRVGVGSDLVGHLRIRMKRAGCKRLTAIVREDDLASQLFFRAVGLRWILTAKQRFGERDGYVMQWRQPIKGARHAQTC